LCYITFINQPENAMPITTTEAALLSTLIANYAEDFAAAEMAGSLPPAEAEDVRKECKDSRKRLNDFIQNITQARK
jgi:hypothetical protein